MRAALAVWRGVRLSVTAAPDRSNRRAAFWEYRAVKLRIACLPLTLALLPVFAPGTLHAAEPVTGRWLTAEKDAVILVAPCGKTLCGTIEKFLVPPPQGNDQRDINNPDPAKRKRRLLGTPIGDPPQGCRCAGGEGLHRPVLPDTGVAQSGVVFPPLIPPASGRGTGSALFTPPACGRGRGWACALLRTPPSSPAPPPPASACACPHPRGRRRNSPRALPRR